MSALASDEYGVSSYKKVKLGEPLEAQMKIEGLGRLTRALRELERAMGELDGDIAQVSFDPADPTSIEQAIQTLEAAVDERVGGYADNIIVAGIAAQLKDRGRQAIIERAQAARLAGSAGK